MSRYILKRSLMMILVILGVILVVYAIMDMSPIDPAKVILGDSATEETVAQLRQEMGLNDPFIVRYLRYVLNLLKGDMGISTVTNVSRNKLRQAAQHHSVGYMWRVFSLIGIPYGVATAKRQYSTFDNVTMVVTLLRSGAALVRSYSGRFSLNLRWFPSAGMDKDFASGA